MRYAALLTLPRHQRQDDHLDDRSAARRRQGRADRGKTSTSPISIDWTVDLLARMRLSKQALTEFEALDGSRIAFDAWAEKWLTTGACTFCPAEGICPKRRKEALSIMGDTAKRWFEEPTTDQPLVVGNAPEIASPEELAHWLDGLEALESWIKASAATRTPPPSAASQSPAG